MSKLKKGLLLLIIILALVLRLLFFRVNETIISSDEIYLYQNSLKPLTFLLDYDLKNYFAQLFRFFNFNWGWVTLSFSTIFTFFLYLFRIPITEQTINLPYIFVGVATVYVVYLLGREFKNKTAGLLAAFLFAIYPTHVSTSRSIGLIGIVATFFFLLTLYFFLKYFELGKCKSLAFLSLGVYFAADHQFYGILPLIFLLGVLFSKEKTIFLKSTSVFKDLVLNKSILFFLIPTIPIFLSAMYLYSKDFFHNAYIMHVFGKQNYLSIFFFETIDDLLSNAGPFIFTLFIVGFFYCLLKIYQKKCEKTTYFIFFWLIIHLVPWIFIVNRQNTVVFEYVMHPTSALIFLSAFFLNDLYKTKKLLFLLITTILLATSIVLISQIVYQKNFFLTQKNTTLVEYFDFTKIPVLGSLKMNLHFGTVGRNTGIKTAGYYLRENSDKDSIIFSDHESFVTEYYTGRTVVGDLDLSTEKEIILNYKKSNKIDYIYLEEKNYSVLKEIIADDGFHPIIFTTQNNKLLGVLYSKMQVQPIYLDAYKTDVLFNEKYGNINSLFIDYI